MQDDLTPATLPLSTSTSDSIALSPIRLKVVSGPDSGREFPLASSTKPFRIGSSAGNDLVLTDRTVSRNHAEIIQGPDGLLVRDLGSTNGTSVGGVRVESAYLQPGSTIRMGTSDVQVVCEQAAWARISSGYNLGEMWGSSPKMRDVYSLIHKVVGTDHTVLITGETGTGKELVARAIHGHGPRSARPIVVIDCGSIPEQLIESELFGHEKGSFTGAMSLHKGAFEQASGGTIFLDEIGELDLRLQPKLLRVLEQPEIRRIGGSQPIPIDVRLIAATNRALKQEVAAGRFREDLYYRLSVVEIALPPLRERREDIPMLVERFVELRKGGTAFKSFSSEAIRLLMDYSWPGNVRQLRNTVERAVLLAEADTVVGDDILRLLPVQGRAAVPATGRSLIEAEKAAIQNALAGAGGNKSEAARTLGIAYSTLFEKIKKYGIGDPPKAGRGHT